MARDRRTNNPSTSTFIHTKNRSIILLVKQTWSPLVVCSYASTWKEGYKICKGALFSLHQDIPHCLDAQSFIPVIIQISTCICFIEVPSAAKPQSGVTSMTIGFIVAKNTNSCFGTATQGTLCVEPFFFAVQLQWCTGTNQRLPRDTTQWGLAVLAISDQRVQGTGNHVDDNKVDLVVEPHTEADLGEGCVPVGG